MRAVVVAVLALIGLFFLSAESIAAPSISLSPKSGPPGTAVTISGTGFNGNQQIDILFEGTPIGTAQPVPMGLSA
jgi:hypothetical protein